MEEKKIVEETKVEVITFEGLEEVEDIVSGACAGSSRCCNNGSDGVIIG